VVAEPANVRIVRAGHEDLDDLVPLFDGYRQFYGQRSDFDGARAFLGERLRRSESVIYVARSDPDAPVGFTQLYPSFSSVSMKAIWILNDLFVRRDLRRSGVARRLLERAAQHAIETGARGLWLATGVANVAAQRLYESGGWRRDSEFQHYYLLTEPP